MAVGERGEKGDRGDDGERGLAGPICFAHSGIEADLRNLDSNVTKLATGMDRVHDRLDEALKRWTPATVALVTILSSTVVGLAVYLVTHR